jgi:hypothetical protein
VPAGSVNAVQLPPPLPVEYAAPWPDAPPTAIQIDGVVQLIAYSGSGVVPAACHVDWEGAEALPAAVEVGAVGALDGADVEDAEELAAAVVDVPAAAVVDVALRMFTTAFF